ncbi:MAG TPA: type II CRISPR-associated endonuclease Cas1 [Tepidisphaeraceae bacterium]
MIKRTIDISEGPTRLSIELDQLVLTRERQEIGRVPCEDLGVLLVDHHSTTYTHAVFTRLAACGTCVVLCGANHLPVALVLPMEANELTARRVRAQAAAPRPLCKRLWRQIVRRKVRLQAENLPKGHPVHVRLLEMAKEVKSGDVTNVEGQAARFYWPAMMGEEFRRDPEGLPPNNLLNYGYMVMRAAVARAIVAAGLHPSFGLQHRHRNNTFALADDLVEVLRPRVDQVVLALCREGSGFVDREAKQKILGIMTEEVRVGDQAGPLMVQLHRVGASLVRCYDREQKRIELPVFVDPPAPAAQASQMDAPTNN